MSERLPDPPQLTEAQRLWLRELGLDRPMLARLARGGAPAPAGDSAGPAQAIGAAHGPAASAAVGAAASTVGETGGMVAGTGQHHGDGRNPAHAALAALKRGAGERGAPAPVPDSAEPARVLPSGESSDWNALEALIQACEACGLHAGRRAAVPGAGATEAVDWLVVGEAPGGRDDGLGRPFQGPAGDLLHTMLAAAGIEPGKRVFYTNLVKCRPRSNRPPTPDEIAACMPHLRSQIALLRPRGILALGRLAAQGLLGEAASFEQYRGRVHTFQSGGGDLPVVVTYHPASLLSRPRHKAASWRDLNLARTLI